MGYEIREPRSPYAETGLVIDNSVAMRWLINSGTPGDQRYAAGVREHIDKVRPAVLVPYLWTYEAANLIAYYVATGDLEHSTAAKALQALHDVLSISIDKNETAAELFENARTHQVSAYDAAYLRLAAKTGLPLATLDKQMRRAARRSGIHLWSS